MINVIAAAQAVVLASGEGTEEMPSVLSVPVDELIIGIIAFIIVFGGLAKFALPNIKKTLAERADAIEGGIERAAKAEAEAQQLAEEYRAQLSAAREEASAIRTQAQADRAAIIEEARNEARAAAQQVTAQAEAQLAADRSQATSQLTRQIGEMSVTLAGKIVGQSLTDDARVRQTVEDFIADLERQAQA
ncbi:MAG: F0F1 ATP synthase subunit B [Actinomycetales bacterium]|nr:F0F1 ATP synthase subunit B [Actinomycetales bacterium]